MTEVLMWVALASHVIVVAVHGEVNDWAAYIDAVPGQNHDKEYEEVAEAGAKLPYEIAKVIFPEVDREYTWRK